MPLDPAGAAWLYAAAGMLCAPLLLAGLVHVGDADAFARIIRSHRLVAGRQARPLARAVGAAEVAGAAALMAVPTLLPDLAPAVLAPVLALFIGFAAYLALAFRRGAGDAECGCGGIGTRLRRFSWLRPAGLAAVLVVLLARWGPAEAATVALAERALGLLGAWSVTTSWLCWRQLRRMNSDAMRAARFSYRLLLPPGLDAAAPARPERARAGG